MVPLRFLEVSLALGSGDAIRGAQPTVLEKLMIWVDIFSKCADADVWEVYWEIAGIASEVCRTHKKIMRWVYRG